MPPDPKLGDFIRDLSHDLINPLSSLVGFLSLILAPDNHEPLTPRQRRMLVAMDRACTHLLGTMRDVSELSKLDDELWDPEPVPLDLRAAAAAVLGEYQVLADNRNISLTLESAAGTPAVPADPQMMERFLDALIRAAGRLTPEGGRISLSLRPDKRGVAGVLEHTGEARPAGAWTEAFGATIRGPRPQEGYAVLGLALARRIALLHRGKLTAEPRPGGGTVFRFRFPPAS